MKVLSVVKTKCLKFSFLIFLFLSSLITFSQEVIEYRGTGRSGHYNETGLLKKSEIFVTSAYDHPGIKLSLSADGKSIQEVWQNETPDTHQGRVVMADGNIYGSNWQNNSKGNWASINLETGNSNRESEWHNKGSVIYADGMLYMYGEKSGNIALARPSAEKMKTISTFKISEGDGPHWAHPAIYNGKRYIRHSNVLAAYNKNV